MGVCTRAPVLAVIATAVLLAGCSDDAPGDNEPDAAVLDEPDGDPRPQRPDAAAFGYSCTVDLELLTDDCDAPVTGDVDAAATTFPAVIDMSGFTELVMTINVCAPTGFAVVLSDSSTGNGGGGDAGSTSNDAEVQLASNTTLSGFANDFHPSGGGTILLNEPDYVSATGCTVLVWTVRDQSFTSDPGVELTSEHLLRIDPPTDLEGTPDALWHLGVNRTFGDPTRTGTGVTRVDIGLR